jgi:hypothetical protein
LALSEFELKFESAKAIKGQIIADFITKHRDPSIDLLEITPWALFFDGSSCGKGGGVGILLILPRGEMFEFAIPIQPTVTNNQAEYEALLRGLQYLREAGAVSVEIYGDSELVIKQKERPVPRCIALSTKLHYNCLLQVYIQQPG